VAENGAERLESRAERLDRELNELLQELRVVLPGVQVLFAFLLTAPFSARFAEITSVQRAAYFVALLCAAVSIVLLMAPSAHHRIQFRQRDKERLLRTSNVLALIGTAFLALSVCIALFVVADFLFDPLAAGLTAVVAGALFVGLWYVVPGLRRAQMARQERSSPS
jgi:amino acid transporter